MTTGPVPALDVRRRFFAEEIEAVAGLRSVALIRALALVPRERFLGPGPWLTMGAAGGGRMRQTVDADPRHLYHNIAIAIDPARQLFNGEPATIVRYIDALDLAPGARATHVGCGTGYYTAIIAETVGADGHVTAIEVDPALAARARENLAPYAWVNVECADGTSVPRDLDGLLVNAGATHAHPAWLEALGGRGRLVLPLTATWDAKPTTVGKGIVFLLTCTEDGMTAQTLGPIAVYSCVGARDPALNESLRAAFGDGRWGTVTRLRRDAHERGAACWYHTDGFCLSG